MLAKLDEERKAVEAIADAKALQLKGCASFLIERALKLVVLQNDSSLHKHH